MAEQYRWNTYLEFDALTDIGMRRANNQDSHAVVPASGLEAWKQRGHLFMVADGMGAHAAGELASKMAADGIPHRYARYPELSPPEALQRAMAETNAEIYHRGHANNEFLHMGTTASALALLPQGAIVGHVGDSRVYRLRGEKLEQLTFDHSLVWELRRTGQFGADAVRLAPKNVITRSLGPHASVEVDLEGPFPIEAGDTFLVCSDGLTGRVSDAEIASVLAHYRPSPAAQLLVDLANLRGGPDNTTVIVVKVIGEAEWSDEVPLQPITMGQRRLGSSAQLAVTIAAIVCGLMVFVFALTGNWGLALGALLLAAGIMGGGYLYVHRLRRLAVSLTPGRRLGQGPHVVAPCMPTPEFVQVFPKLIQQLRVNVEEARWCDEFPDVERCCQEANRAVRAGDYDQALTHYAAAVHAMMEDIRGLQKRRSSDSAIDY